MAAILDLRALDQTIAHTATATATAATAATATATATATTTATATPPALSSPTSANRPTLPATPARTPGAANPGVRSVRPKSTASTSHFNTPTHLPFTIMPTHSRAKTASHIDLVRRGKRLSLQLPLQPAAGSLVLNPTPPHTRPQSMVGTPSSTLSPPDIPAPTETNILAVLAAQDRYVLELKEELLRAETDLKTLKKYWSTHESSKRRNQARRIAPLRPLDTLLANGSVDQGDAEDDENTALQQDKERKKAMMNTAKTPSRKVFSGSRHLRTLSLLSPENTYTPSFPQPLDLLDDESLAQRPCPPGHAYTSPDISKSIPAEMTEEQYNSAAMPNKIQREKIIRAGTQMATDFKNGLVGFIEDLKQATVGDQAAVEAEAALSSSSPKTMSSKSSRKGSEARPTATRANSKPPTGSIGEDFWKENGLSEPKTLPTTKKSVQTPQKQTAKLADEDEDWISWDTPKHAYATATVDIHNSSDESDEAGSLMSGQSSARTSALYHAKRHDSKASFTTSGSIANSDDATMDSKRISTAWADLGILSPKNITRVASTMMKDWEKQLTPSPESRGHSQLHGDYIGRAPTPPCLI